MIEIRGISKWYGSVPVLSDCSARVDRGEVVVVCGPYGSGKSTRIKTVNALEPFERGDVVVDGLSLADRRTDLPALRRRVGRVFQHFELPAPVGAREPDARAEAVLKRPIGEAHAARRERARS
jgi:glutamate/aspartate transport system ATP-binding protein